MAVITPANYQNVAIIASAYFSELVKKPLSLMDTGIVSRSTSAINGNGDSFIGQLRFYRDEDAITNTPSYTDPTPGTISDINTGLMTYIKVARAWGYGINELNEIISKEGNLNKAARVISDRFANNLRKELDRDMFNVLHGYAESLAVANPGITDFNQYDDPTRSFFIDVNADGHFGTAPASAATARTLVDPTLNFAGGAQRLIDAIGMAWGEKDDSDSYYYLVVDTKTVSALRALNITDRTRVTEGKIEFETILSGKFRLIVRNSIPSVTPGAHLVPPTNNVSEFSTRVSFVIQPGALAFHRIPVSVPIEYHNDPAAYHGAGVKQVWARTSYIMHPYGMSWTGPTNVFPAGTDLATGANWTVEYKNTNLAILPIFHA